MNILLTGDLGYIGKHLKYFLQKVYPEYKLHGIDIKNGPHEDILKVFENKELASVNQFDYVFHLAALPSVVYSVENPVHTLETNVLGTSKMLAFAKSKGCKRFIFSSSSSIYGNSNGPNSPYAAHKLMSEYECNLYSSLYEMDTVCLRYFNVYSPDQLPNGAYSNIVASWMESLRCGTSLRIDGTGEQKRDLVHVEDVVSANIFAMNYPNNFNGQSYDVGTGKAFSINEMKQLAIKTLNPSNLPDGFHYNYLDFYNAPARKGDVNKTLANTYPLECLGWKAQVEFEKGFAECLRTADHDYMTKE